MKDNKIAALALTFSIVAIALSLFASWGKLTGKGASAGGLELQAQIKQGIEAYVQAQQPVAQRIAEKVDNKIEDDDAVEGGEKAPVTLVEFSDYECPYCKRFFDQTLGELRSEFLEAGKAKLVYRDYPLPFHPNARPAAVSAECARKQGGDKQYFAFHDLIFSKGFDEAALKSHAAILKLNASALDSCAADPATGAEVDADIAAGQAAGISGTPGFLLLMEKDKDGAEKLKTMEFIQNGQYVIQYIETENGQRMGLRISGAHPFSTFKKAIEIGL